MYNKVILIGRVAADPEMRYTPTGKPVVNFVIAVNRPKFGEAQQSNADFINIVAWEKLAEICANYLTKGKLIAIDGALHVRSYETKEGQKRKAYEVVAKTMKMLDRSKSSTGSSAEEVTSTYNKSGTDNAANIETTEIAEEDLSMEEVPF